MMCKNIFLLIKNIAETVNNINEDMYFFQQNYFILKVIHYLHICNVIKSKRLEITIDIRQLVKKY